jgi:hypothetical protein
VWKKRFITIQGLTEAGSATPIPYLAFVNGPLAVHRRLMHVQPPQFSETSWCITHIRSGYTFFASYPLTKRQAQRVAEQLLPLADWSQAKTKLLAEVKRKKLIPQIEELIRQAA